jgi:hypothetical protein
MPTSRAPNTPVRLPRSLRGSGCEVSIIDAQALASIDPKGGEREPVQGWDAADTIEEWSNVAELRKQTPGLRCPLLGLPEERAGDDNVRSHRP